MSSLFTQNEAGASEILSKDGNDLFAEVSAFFSDIIDKWEDFPTREIESVAVNALIKITSEARGNTDAVSTNVVDKVSDADDGCCSNCTDKCKPQGSFYVSDDDQNEINNIIGDDDSKPQVASTVIDEFSGNYEFLRSDFLHPQSSVYNFKDDDDEVISDRYTFSSAQHAYQTNKTLDKDTQDLIMQAPDARTATHLGRQAKLIDNWDAKKLEIMERILLDKFENLELKIKLLLTGDADLVQGRCKDTYWGVDKNGNGDNNLGKLLVKIREKFLREEGTAEEIISAALKRNSLSFVIPWVQFPIPGKVLI